MQNLFLKSIDIRAANQTHVSIIQKIKSSHEFGASGLTCLSPTL